MKSLSGVKKQGSLFVQ